MKGKGHVWQRNVLYPMTIILVILFKERIIRGITRLINVFGIMCEDLSCNLSSFNIHINLLVEQGCGDSPKEVKDIQFAVCEKSLCNTKELFEKTLFCFIKQTEKEKYKKAIKQCDKECFVFRDVNGHCI